MEALVIWSLLNNFLMYIHCLKNLFLVVMTSVEVYIISAA